MEYEYEVPDSVLQYVRDPAIRSAVLDLLNDQTVPEDINWEDLATYYRAYLAARQFQTDWGTTAIHVWGETWGQVLDSGWTPVTPAEQADYQDASIFVTQLFLEMQTDKFPWFARIFTRGDYELWTAVLLEPDEGISLLIYADPQTAFAEGMFSPFEQGYFKSRPKAVLNEAGVLDVRELAIVAKGAMDQLKDSLD